MPSLNSTGTPEGSMRAIQSKHVRIVSPSSPRTDDTVD